MSQPAAVCGACRRSDHHNNGHILYEPRLRLLSPSQHSSGGGTGFVLNVKYVWDCLELSQKIRSKPLQNDIQFLHSYS